MKSVARVLRYNGATLWQNKKNQKILFLERYFRVNPVSFGAQPEQARAGLLFAEFLPALINRKAGIFMVIQPCPPHFFVFQGKSQRLDQMEL